MVGPRLNQALVCVGFFCYRTFGGSDTNSSRWTVIQTQVADLGAPLKFEFYMLINTTQADF